MADIIDLKTRLELDRRAETRRRVYKGAVLRFNSGYGVFEAIVRNQSQKGARLAFGEALGVPPTFVLAIAGESIARTAKVRWRSLTAMGIEFI